MTEIATLIDQLKNHLAENDGEVVYWGEKIARRFDVALIDGQPGSEEADKLLNKILGAIGLDRSRVFIAALPLNEKAFRAARPRFVVLLGPAAADAFHQSSLGVEWTDFQVISTHHPMDLLRDESLKKAAWDDMKKLRDLLAAR